MKGRIPKSRRNKRIVAINDTRIEQYGILSANDIRHNAKAIDTMKKWLNCKTNDKHGLLIYGPSGCGKTCVSKVICESEGYDVKYFNGALYGKSSNSKDVISIEDFIREASRCSNVLSLMKEDKSKPRVTIIDQIDQYLSGSGSKTKLVALKKMLSTTRNRVILITANVNASKIRTIAKLCTKLRFSAPTKREIALIIGDFCDKTGLKLSMVAKVYIENKIDQDVRQLLIILYELYKLYYKTTTVDLVQLERYLNAHKDVGGDVDVFKLTERIMFARELSIEDKLQLYDKFPYKLPMFMQENVLRFTIDWQKIMAATERFSDADLIAGSIYDRMDSEMYVARYIYGIIAVIPSFMKRTDTQYRQLMTKQIKSIETTVPLQSPIEGTSTSFILQRKGTEKVNTSSVFGSINTQRANHDTLIAIRSSSMNRFSDIDTFSYGGQIIRKRIETDQISEVVRLARDYGFQYNRKYNTKKISELLYDIATKLYFSKDKKIAKPRKAEIDKMIAEFERQELECVMNQFRNLNVV